jgi:hypothetical protein
MPSEVCEMPFPQCIELFDYWRRCPPTHEMLAMFARVYTTWEPGGAKTMTSEEWQAAHRASLEQRWKSGQFMSVADLFKATGGKLRAAGGGDGHPYSQLEMGGIGPFPGSPEAQSH